MTLASINLWILRTLQLQLFITLASLPILIYWGLPISLISPLANIIFTPVLTLFLLLSSLLFFTELAHIPNSWISWLINQATEVWSIILHYGKQEWLLSFKPQSCLIFIGVMGIAIILMSIKKWHNSWKSVVSLGMLNMILFGYLFCYDYYTNVAACLDLIPCNKGFVPLIITNNHVSVIDQGYIGQTINAPDWIEYTLQAVLAKKGKSVINDYIIMQPTIMSLKAATRLAQIVTIKNIYLPYWSGDTSVSMGYAYGSFFKTIKSKKINFIRLSPDKELCLANENKITLKTFETLKYQTITFPAIEITSQCSTKPFKCQSSYCEKITNFA